MPIELIGKLASVYITNWQGKRKRITGRINWLSSNISCHDGGYDENPLVRLDNGNALYRLKTLKLIQE